MRMLGLTSIVLAAGLALAGPAIAQDQTAPTAAAETAAEAPPASAPDAAAGDAAATDTAAVADPTLLPDGTPKRGPDATIGIPQDGLFGLQDQVTPTGREAHWFHNQILLPLITAISLLVLALLVWVVIRYRRARNPTPSRTSHNTFIEVVWTLVPVLILLAIAIPSIRLLAAQYKPAPEGAITLKAIGNQWFWSYEYPDNGDIQITANMLKEQSQVGAGERYRTDADGPRLLATDNRIVLPVGVPIRLITTATDVIHSWAVPAFYIKLDAVPGRLNETTFTIEREGVYYGQCSELCGARHAFMPITVEAVSPAEFARWVASKGGTMPGAAGAPGTEDAASTEAGSVPVADEAIIDNTAGAAPATNQAATGNDGGIGQADQ